ncbi:MAG: efflux RND transporter periplasmic adaptor subunit [Pyrinomonadaceae bacterium]|nr:efflux RND transporter periplasmic adaptor subunit [Acidobacteriota bacterium]MBP7375113.1 efflux RND transporter periplasmic adaptor subunit [Pyrinomonadaceae bacterium]
MRNYLVGSVICAMAMAGSLACGSGSTETKRNNSNTDANPGDAPLVITVAKSESRDVASVIQATGSMTAEESSDIAPKTAGKIADISVNVGQFVASGSVIARIDDRDARLRLATARASVKRAQASVLQAEARLGLGRGGSFNASTIPEVRGANANYEQTLAELKQAEANEKRYRELTETGDVALITYEQYRTARDTARARSNVAKQQLEAAINNAKQNNQAIASARADVESAQTQVADAEQAITDTVIKAPFSGFISNRAVAVGEYVSSASVVATILRTNPIKVLIQVAEADIPYIGIGRGVSVQVDAYKDRKFAGTVIAVNPAVDPVSRSAVVEATVENGDNSLRQGMFATVRINRDGGGKGVFVPRTAVYNHQATQSYRVFVVQEGIVKLRVVQLGTEEGGFAQIVTGVEADETVATSNLESLYEGAKVSF